MIKRSSELINSSIILIRTFLPRLASFVITDLTGYL